ncbi:hypothetical protein [Pseudomonas sp. efr-133-TYG-23]|uniref:hypothetical protein n=1 Tax=Pseudomonas sp. efr-133-TYG-23 TaxID=3040309 RepID=UPI0025564916|nr:hypothetical protein [Pseudomonas sp. efr-133-TYG-23]
MRLRGDIFWRWADPKLHSRTHEETLRDGTHIDVQVRLSQTGQTQLFIGIYAPDGMALHEEAYDSHPRETMTRAMVWGVGRARKLAADGAASLRLAAGSL